MIALTWKIADAVPAPLALSPISSPRRVGSQAVRE